ncbi:MAG TPA: rhomboid family intramembrane serine protease [Candidatus Eisenbergiella merdipullorum]|uniref:Rhomboid family intramembrane serine protease n=1 Tax=Candidatus Eisenbergiella merdipullorum TaxID=2838553 RepID=A0A9D2I2K9_9FIRM|nr:rhomboid family intramembrane serine protease [Candidatus Eisenbergiella merdipullorum]
MRYLILFFLSGICGNLFSAVYELSTGTFYESIGASGAVFGLVGGLFYLVLAKKGRAAGISVQRMVLMIALSLYAGFQSVMVNNAAHLGGLLSGFLTAFLLCHVGKLPDERFRRVF